MKRVRSADTVAGMAAAFIAAAKGLAEPPEHVHLRPQDRPYWEAIVANRARDEWTDVMLATAAQLARTQADIAEWSAQLESEPAVLASGDGGMHRLNPLVTAIDMATRRQLALMRALGLSVKADPDSLRKRQQTLKAAREAHARAEAQSLLA